MTTAAELHAVLSLIRDAKVPQLEHFKELRRLAPTVVDRAIVNYHPKVLVTDIMTYQLAKSQYLDLLWAAHVSLKATRPHHWRHF